MYIFTFLFVIIFFVIIFEKPCLRKDNKGSMYDVCVVVNFLSQLIFIFPLFLGMIMNANEFETKEIQKLTEIKN